MVSAVTIRLICFRLGLAIGLSTVVTRSRVGTSGHLPAEELRLVLALEEHAQLVIGRRLGFEPFLLVGLEYLASRKAHGEHRLARSHADRDIDVLPVGRLGFLVEVLGPQQNDGVLLHSTASEICSISAHVRPPSFSRSKSSTVPGYGASAPSV